MARSPGEGLSMHISSVNKNIKGRESEYTIMYMFVFGRKSQCTLDHLNHSCRNLRGAQKSSDVCLMLSDIESKWHLNREEPEGTQKKENGLVRECA